MITQQLIVTLCLLAIAWGVSGLFENRRKRKQRMKAKELTRHEVKEGKHNYKPGHGLSFRTRTNGFYLKFKIPAEAYYHPTDGPLGRDGKDINKLGGVSYLNLVNPFTWPKNRNAVLIGWRPSIQWNRFEIFAYVNDPTGGHKHERLGIVDANQQALATVGRWDKDTMYFTLSLPGQNLGTAKMEIYKRSFQVNVGPWFGGNRTAPMDHYLDAFQYT